MSIDDIAKVDNDTNYEKQITGLTQYYKGLHRLAPQEQDSLVLTPAFSFYSNTMRLSAFEKLNVLERETVKIYRSRLTYREEEVEHKQAEQVGVQEFQDTMEKEKYVL